MIEQSHFTVGSQAPIFSLPDEQGNTINLESLLESGPVLLIFYPGDMTPGCTMQLCAIKDDWDEFKKAGIQVFGINHADATSHQAFKKIHQFPFPLLIDTGKKVSGRYEAIRTFFKTTIIRRTVVGIDTNGTVIYYRHGMPKNSDIMKAFLKTNTGRRM